MIVCLWGVSPIWLNKLKAGIIKKISEMKSFLLGKLILYLTLKQNKHPDRVLIYSFRIKHELDIQLHFIIRNILVKVYLKVPLTNKWTCGELNPEAMGVELMPASSPGPFAGKPTKVVYQG